MPSQKTIDAYDDRRASDPMRVAMAAVDRDFALAAVDAVQAQPTAKRPPAPTLEGKKYDNGKQPWHLLPFDALDVVVAVLNYGMGKYGARNWEAGMSWDRCYSAAMRHMTAWYRRSPADTDTGISHLAHAICCLLFLLAYELRGTGQDTRP